MTDQNKTEIPIFSSQLEHPYPGYVRIFVHPQFPDKIIKQSEGYYPNTFEDIDQTRAYVGMLKDIYGVPSANVEFVVGPNTDEYPTSMGCIYAITDRIPGIPLMKAIQGGDGVGIDACKEADCLMGKLIRHLRDTIDRGGPLDGEFLRYDQYVYSPDAKEGDRVILVDLEPASIFAVGPPSMRSQGEGMRQVFLALSKIAEQIIEISGRIDPESRTSFTDAIQAIVDNNSATRSAKETIIKCVSQRDIGALRKYFDVEEEDWVFNEDGTVGLR